MAQINYLCAGYCHVITEAENIPHEPPGRDGVPYDMIYCRVCGTLLPKQYDTGVGLRIIKERCPCCNKYIRPKHKGKKRRRGKI